MKLNITMGPWLSSIVMTIAIFFATSFVLNYAFGALNVPIKALQIPKVLVVATATIANSATVSAAIPTSGLSLVGIQLPAAFTGTAITFQGSVDGVTYQVVKSTTSGTSLSYTVAQATYVAIDPVPFYGLAYIKLVSGSTEGGARSFTVALKGL